MHKKLIGLRMSFEQTGSVDKLHFPVSMFHYSYSSATHSLLCYKGSTETEAISFSFIFFSFHHIIAFTMHTYYHSCTHVQYTFTIEAVHTNNNALQQSTLKFIGWPPERSQRVTLTPRPSHLRV